MKLTVKMIWIEKEKKWYMLSATDNAHIYEFFDCRVVRAGFRPLDKTKENFYTIEIKKIK